MISDFPRVMSEIRRLFLAIGILLVATKGGGAERINQEGRILPPTRPRGGSMYEFNWG